MSLNNAHTLKKIIFIGLVIFLQIEVISGQSFQNLNFEQVCDTCKTSLCHWDLSWKYNAKINKRIKSVKNRSLEIEGLNETSIGFVEQTTLIRGSSNLKIIRFSGKIKTENVKGNGAGLSVSIIDKQGNYLFSEHMGNGTLDGVTGTNSWEEFTLQAICDSNAFSVKIGAILYGQGKAQFDDFKFEIDSVENRAPNEMSQRYLNHVSNIIEDHSLMRDSVDLKSLKVKALKIAGKAKNYSDCHLAVQYFIKSLGDHHSFLMKPEVVQNWQNGNDELNSEKQIDYASYEMIDNFGYISVPGFHSNDHNLKIKFADSIQHALRFLDQKNLKGWIVDLRKNDGGNMEPMLAGLGPLFDNEILGYLVDVNGNKNAWGYRNGAPFSDNERGESATFPIELTNQNLPIAVLIGPSTGSSGEIIVISFIENKNTKMFGNPTWGISTGNGEFELLDGAKLFLTSTIMADRTGKIYGGKIQPDYQIEETNGSEDAVLLFSMEWLRNNQD